jgi:cytoskeletal protein RodZ
VDKATLLNDTYISIEISYLDSRSDYREAVKTQTAVPTDSSSQRNRSKKNSKWSLVPWALILLVLLVVALIWMAQ